MNPMYLSDRVVHFVNKFMEAKNGESHASGKLMMLDGKEFPQKLFVS